MLSVSEAKTMCPSDPSQQPLVQFAIARLQELFPQHWRIMIERSQRITAKRAAPPQTAVAESKPAAKPEVASTNARCCVRGCVFPSKLDGLCRTHYVDSKCEKSLLPSTTAVAIDNLACAVTL